MSEKEIHAVTGAFGFSGRYIARRLLDAGRQVVTLTNSYNRPDPFGGRIKVHPLRFERPNELVRSLERVSVLYNTYYVRFNYKGRVSFSYSEAVENSSKLFAAAREAGVKRIVHISITNPSMSSKFEYFRGKARIENLLRDSGLSFSILRPAVLFGDGGILINNIAWLLRRFPVFGVFGNGNYRLQPIYVDDLAMLAVKQGKRSEESVIDAIGPETFAFRGLVEQIGRIIGKTEADYLYSTGHRVPRGAPPRNSTK
jgi:nucleoside-diphosphate-sugar epimerase